MYKRIMKRLFVLVCVVSLLITNNVVSMPEVVADASSGSGDYRIVTPRTLGVEDGVFETPQDVATPVAQRAQMSIDGAKFCATLGFSTTNGSTFEYLKNTSGSGIQLIYYSNAYKYPVLCNYLTSGKMYAGGSFVNGEYQGGADIRAYGSGVNRHYILDDAIAATGYPFHGTTFTLWYTTELVDFDGDGSANDLKLGVWFNETLYKGIYFYIVNCSENYLGCISTTKGITSIASPAIEEEENFDDYRLVTPKTLGIENAVFDTPQDVATPTTQREQMEIDKVKFCGTVGFSTTNGSTMEYLKNASGSGIQLIYYSNTYKYPVLCNYLTSGKMYAGGSFVNGEYQGGADVRAYGSGVNRHYILDDAIATTGYPFHGTTFTLWYTTKLVDFDGDGKIDDLKLGVWFNESLYKDIYFYIIDCSESYLGCFSTTNGITSITSPDTGTQEPERPQIEEPTFPEITFADFDIDPNTYGCVNNGAALAASGSVADGFANKTFVGTANFTSKASVSINFAGKDNAWEGVKLTTMYSSGAVKLHFAEAKSRFEAIPLDDAVANLPLEDDIEIKLSVEITDLDEDGADDVRFWLYFEDELYGGAPIKEAVDYAQYVGNYLGIYSNHADAKVTIASKEIERPVVVGPTFSEYTFSDCYVDDGTYGYTGSLATTGRLEGGFTNKTFVGHVNFTKQVSTSLNFAGKESAWEGVKLTTRGAGQLYFAEAYTRFEPVVISGTEGLEDDVEVKLSIEVTDLDGDGEDDVRFWLYFDNVLYKNAPIKEATDYAQYLGEYIGIYSSSEGSSVTIRSKDLNRPVVKVDFSIVGFTEDWEKTLLQQRTSSNVIKDNNSAPYTGDTTHVGVYFAAIILAAVVVGGLLYIRRREKEMEI